MINVLRLKILKRNLKHEIHSMQIVEKILNENKLSKISVSFNGGKDSTALLYIFAVCFDSKFGSNSRPLLDVVCIDEKNEFLELSQFRTKLANQLNFKIKNLPPPMSKSLKQHSEKHKIKAIFSGQRKADPGAKHLKEITLCDKDYGDFLRVNPLLDWTHKDVWDFILSYELPFCSLYRNGFTSLGLSPFSLKNPLLWSKDVSGGFCSAWELREGGEERLGRALMFSKGDFGKEVRIGFIKGDNCFNDRNAKENIKNMKTQISEILKGKTVKYFEIENESFNEMKKGLDIGYFI